jgi:hypothetical protein
MIILKRMKEGIYMVRINMKREENCGCRMQ